MERSKRLWCVFCRMEWVDQEASLGLRGKESTYPAGDMGLISWVRKTPWRRKWQSTLVFLDREAWWATVHGITKDSDMTFSKTTTTKGESG